VRVIGLTGGIASGVTLVARIFRDLGAVVIEADEIAREVVEPGTETYHQVVEAFGPEVVRADGTLDRRRLGKVVFEDPSARVRLNALTHPAIRRRIWERIADVRHDDPEALVIVDIPLLLDTAGPETFDLDGVIVVTATPDLQLSRTMKRDGLTWEEAQRRVDAQRPVALKAAEADWVVDNTSTVAHTRSQVEALWKQLTEPPRS